jgi:hypothetical protein
MNQPTESEMRIGEKLERGRAASGSIYSPLHSLFPSPSSNSRKGKLINAFGTGARVLGTGFKFGGKSLFVGGKALYNIEKAGFGEIARASKKGHAPRARSHAKHGKRGSSGFSIPKGYALVRMK